MRILHVTPSYLPAARYGGPIFSVHGLAKGQAGLGHEVEVFTTNVDGPSNSPVPLGAPVDMDGVRVSYFQTRFGRRLYRSPKMGRALRKRLAGFDIVHLHSVFLWPTLAAARIARNRQIPYVLSPRGMLAPDLIRQKSPFLKTAWIELFERRTIRDAAALHVTSQIEAEDLERFNFRLPPVWVTPNGVELPELEKASSTVSEDVRRAVSGGPFVLALGRICWKKNLLGLVDAIATIPGLRCVIAGNSEDDHASDVRRRIAERGVEDRTIVLDRLIDGRDKWCLYRSCSVFALPSHHENFGNVALEAMAFCKPVVVSSRAGVASVVAEAGAGTVVEPETEALARAVAALMASPDQREAHGKAGGLAVEERYGWHRIASEMMGHYRTIADRRS